MKRLVLDTSIYIDGARTGAFHSLRAGLKGPVMLALPVAAELLRGGSPTADALVRAALKTGRYVEPSLAAWQRAASVMRGLDKRGPCGDLWFDALIAMSARDVGATVYTTNRRDFEKIRSVEAFDLEIMEPGAVM